MWKENWKRIQNGRYIWAKIPGHPNAIGGKGRSYVYEHRVVMENKLGRLLEKDEFVHHINHNGLDIRPENLQLVTNLTHARIDHRCGTSRYVTLNCETCDIKFAYESRFLKIHDHYFCSRTCQAKKLGFQKGNKAAAGAQL